MHRSPSEPIEAIITRFHRPSQPRAGDRSARLWWNCPFHDDPNPSLCVQPGGDRYKCFGCGAAGDAIEFVRRLNPSMSFRDALCAIGGDPGPRRDAGPPKAPTRKAPTRKAPAPRPPGWQEFARMVVMRAETALQSPRMGGDQGPLAYLKRRGLSDATIRAARLGLQVEDEWVSGIFPGAKVCIPKGIVIPWFEGPEVTLVNVRRFQGEPKYWAIKGSRRGGIYPAREAIEAGRPLVLAEGELDALLLGQELAGLASVVTLGSAGDRPKSSALNAMLGARPWLVAYDADDAGEESAGHWLARSDRCRRVRPPDGKDWTDARHSGTDLRAWWSEIIEVAAGPSTPPVEVGPDSPVNGPGDPSSGWHPPAWWIVAMFDQLAGCVEAFEERAAIMEFDGGLGREEAESRASDSIPTNTLAKSRSI